MKPPLITQSRLRPLLVPYSPAQLCLHDARVQAVDRDVGVGGEALTQLISEEDVGQLGLA